jgi:hypothetical protein
MTLFLEEPSKVLAASQPTGNQFVDIMSLKDYGDGWPASSQTSSLNELAAQYGGKKTMGSN